MENWNKDEGGEVLSLPSFSSHEALPTLSVCSLSPIITIIIIHSSSCSIKLVPKSQTPTMNRTKKNTASKLIVQECRAEDRKEIEFLPPSYESPCKNDDWDTATSKSQNQKEGEKSRHPQQGPFEFAASNSKSSSKKEGSSRKAPKKREMVDFSTLLPASPAVFPYRTLSRITEVSEYSSRTMFSCETTSNWDEQRFL